MRSVLFSDKSKLLFSFVVLSWVVIWAMLAFSPVDVDLASFIHLLISPILLYVAAWYYKTKGSSKLSASCEVIAAGFLLLIPVLVSTYLAMSFGMPLVDAQLIAMDEALGFDWLSFIRLVDQSALLSHFLYFAYSSLTVQLFVIPLVLVYFNKTNRAYAFIMAYGLLCFISSTIAIWYPALGAYDYLGFTQASMNHINVHVGYDFLESFHAVRTGEQFVLSLGVASGIVTFPSVHVAIAVLAIWATWQIRGWHEISLILNIAMTISAITHGSHYFVDVVMGMGVCALTISIVSLLFLRDELRKTEKLKPAYNQ